MNILTVVKSGSIVTSIFETGSGSKSTISDMRFISVDDMLGRDPINHLSKSGKIFLHSRGEHRAETVIQISSEEQLEINGVTFSDSLKASKALLNFFNE